MIQLKVILSENVNFWLYLPFLLSSRTHMLVDLDSLSDTLYSNSKRSLHIIPFSQQFLCEALKLKENVQENVQHNSTINKRYTKKALV